MAAAAFREDRSTMPWVLTSHCYRSIQRSRSAASSRRRLAYLSADFRQHATSYLMAGLLEAHDKSRFDVIGLSVGPNDGSQLRKSFERSFTDFRDMAALSNDRLAAEIAKIGGRCTGRSQWIYEWNANQCFETPAIANPGKLSWLPWNDGDVSVRLHHRGSCSDFR